MTARIAEVSRAFDAPIVGLLEDALVVRVRAAIDAALAAKWADGVRAARAHWNEDFDATQFSFGRAWYTDLEQERTSAYFAEAAASDARVESFCPGMQKTMRDLVARAAGVEVAPREGWCGPGVHIFPAGALVSRQGGEIHFDSEGLTPAHARDHAPALTVVLMLAPPTSGGGLRVWDVLYGGTDDVSDEDLAQPHVTCDYGVGDLVLIDSFRLHQIQAFSGAIDRISATCHAALVAGQWESWF